MPPVCLFSLNRPLIALISKNGSRLLERFIYWNGCTCGALQYTGFLTHWYKRKAAKKSKTACCNVSFLKLRYIYLKGTDFDPTNLESTRYCQWITLWRDTSASYGFLLLYCLMALKGLTKMLLMLSGME